MSAAEIADYVSFGLARRQLTDICKEYLIPVINGQEELVKSDFATIEGYIRTLLIYPEMANIAESRTVLEKAAYVKGIDGWGAKDKRRKATAELYTNLLPVLSKSGTLMVSKRPRKNPEVKSRIIPIMRRFDVIKNNIPGIPEGLSVSFLDAEELFMGAHGTMYADLKGILAELKSAYPLAEVEDHYQDTYKLMNPRPIIDSLSGEVDESSMKEKKLQDLPSAIASLAALFAVLKTEYDITDEEVGYIPGLKEARAELERMTAVSTMLLEQLEDAEREPAIKPFNLKPFEKSLFNLTAHATRATGNVDGKRIVTTSEGEMKLIFNELMTQLENTQFTVLYGRTQNMIDHMHEIVQDPNYLIRAIEEYTLLAQLEIQRYKLRAEKLATLAGIMRAG